ncbi:MAG: nitroreductase family protein [Desulfobacteraceae bacterium]|nr:nitroreductase family protein [Desulfobacteraceae bacterium]MBC2755689.1 nitroreductase family protein [Desulfobacteraceae bacterium]
MTFKDVIYGRRAVNFFDPEKDVPELLLNEIIEMASQAPSGFNIQPWSLIVLRDYDDKMRLQKHAWNQSKVSEAPVTLIVLADTEGWRAGNPFLEKDFQEMLNSGAMVEEQRQWFYGVCESLYGASEARKIAFSCKNTGFFAMSLMLAAKSLGLDTHPMDGFDIDAVRGEFKIPDNYWIPLLISVGYFKSDQKRTPSKWRKTVDEIVVRFD